MASADMRLQVGTMVRIHNGKYINPALYSSVTISEHEISLWNAAGRPTIFNESDYHDFNPRYDAEKQAEWKRLVKEIKEACEEACKHE